MYKFLLLTVFALANTVFAGEVLYNKAGFSIDTLDSAVPAQGMQSVQMFLPAAKGFAANVNVQVQPYPDSLKAYKKLSEGQFVELGLKTVSSSLEGNVLVLEYSGVLNGLNLHFYAKAVKKGQFVYLATATDLVSEWPNNSAELKKVVDSLQLQ